VAYFSSAVALLSIDEVLTTEEEPETFNFRGCPSTTLLPRDLEVSEWDLLAEEGQRPSSVPPITLPLILVLFRVPFPFPGVDTETASLLPSGPTDKQISLARPFVKLTVLPHTHFDKEEEDFALLPVVDDFWKLDLTVPHKVVIVSGTFSCLWEVVLVPEDLIVAAVPTFDKVLLVTGVW